MGATVKTYKPSQVSLQIAGYQLGGLVSISVSFNSPQFKTIRGIRGQNTRVRNTDNSLVITIEVLQTSVTNDLLSSIVFEDLKTGNGRLAVYLSDLSGTTKIQSTNAFVESYADFQFNNNLTTRSWKISLLSTEVGGVNVGSNIRVGPSMLSQALDLIGL